MCLMFLNPCHLFRLTEECPICSTAAIDDDNDCRNKLIVLNNTSNND